MIESNETAKQQFLKKYQDRFEKQILNGFPFTQNENNKKSKEMSGGGVKCEYQNLSIAILFLAFTLKNHQRFYKYRERVFSFIEECIINWKDKDQEFIECMRKFVRMLFHHKDLRNCFGVETQRIFNQLVIKCNVDQLYDAKLALVCEIIKNTDISCEKLILQMVNVIALKTNIPLYLITALSSVAKRSSKIFIGNIHFIWQFFCIIGSFRCCIVVKFKTFENF